MISCACIKAFRTVPSVYSQILFIITLNGIGDNTLPCLP
jgi:hypothetical protein